jgi:hypothetical protein
MKHQTATLEGALLDAAVAKALGWRWIDGRRTIRMVDGRPEVQEAISGDDNGEVFEPSWMWEHGGPIIDRERIGTSFEEATNLWHAEVEHAARADGVQRTFSSGPTALIAAMRTFVASKLGPEVEL